MKKDGQQDTISPLWGSGRCLLEGGGDLGVLDGLPIPSAFSLYELLEVANT